MAIAETATLPIQYTAGNNGAATQNITLTGTGTAVANFTLLPANLTFTTTQLVGTTSPSQSVTLLTEYQRGGGGIHNYGERQFQRNRQLQRRRRDRGWGKLHNQRQPRAHGRGHWVAQLTLSATFAGGAMQQTTLSGTGADFAVTSLPASVTVTNNAGMFGANVTTVPMPAPAGFAPSVSFMCTTTIPMGTCTAATVMAPAPITVNISVASAVPPSAHRVDGQRLMRPAIPLVTALLLFLTLPLLRRRRAWLGVCRRRAGAVRLLKLHRNHQKQKLHSHADGKLDEQRHNREPSVRGAGCRAIGTTFSGDKTARPSRGARFFLLGEVCGKPPLQAALILRFINQ